MPDTLVVHLCDECGDEDELVTRLYTYYEEQIWLCQFCSDQISGIKPVAHDWTWADQSELVNAHTDIVATSGPIEYEDDDDPGSAAAILFDLGANLGKHNPFGVAAAREAA